MKQEEIDREFIQTEDKGKLPYEKSKDVSHEVLFEFINEIDVYYLAGYCCMYNNYELVKKLIDVGVDFNENSQPYGLKPIENACAHNSYECAKLLIQNGVYTNGLDLYLSCSNESNECTELLLNEIETKSTGDKYEIIMNALEWARKYSNKETENFLMNHSPPQQLYEQK